MSRRHGGGHALPENPHWLEFPRSDGDPGQLPKNTSKVVDNEGQVNYMRPVGPDESLSIMWRVAVGGQLAIRMNLPEGPKYVLKEFPDGYQLYDHNKGPAKAPRHDPYLCGSMHVNRFRSTNEFIPHALWLMQDPTMNRGNCQCKYCTKQPQRIISDNMGLSARRSASVSATLPPASRAPRQRREPREQRQQRAAATKPYAAVRRAPKPPKTLVGPELYISPERDLDIRTSLSYGEGQRPRWFRKGELLWCHLEPPIRGKSPEEDIMFWPGLVDDLHIKTMAVPTAPLSDDVDMEHLYAEAAEGNPGLGVPPGDPSAAGPSGSGATAPIEAQGSVPWKVQHWYVYKVKLLGTHVNFFVTDEQVLPYLAYAPSDKLLHRVQDEFSNFLQGVPIDQMDRDLDQNMFTFDPMEPELGEEQGGPFEKYKRATPSYTFAIQVASNIAHFWLPTDEWECKFHFPSPSPPSASRPHSPAPASQPQAQFQAQTLQSLIQQSLNSNGVSPPTMAGPSGSQVNEPESISTPGYAPRPTPKNSQLVVQTRFQGLWWGTERIWTDEIVRLKISRAQFAPNGTDIIYPPAGPSASSLQDMMNSPLAAVEPQQLGAGARGLFLRLEGLFIVEVPSADGSGVTKECRASGMLYELADLDWEEVADANEEHEVNGADKGTDKGKGKARETADDPMSTSQDHAETASSIPNQTPPAAGASQPRHGRSLSAQISHPVLSTPYPLPPAPFKYRFRPILPPGHEVVLSLSLISGRYYPGLFYHPLMAPTVQQALNLAIEDGGLYRNQHLWAMDGLLPGVHQSMDPQFWRGSRVIMLQEADKEARDRFRERWEEVKLARLHPPQAGVEGNHGEHMEVDA